jgi:PAS domain S-box-containing protein
MTSERKVVEMFVRAIITPRELSTTRSLTSYALAVISTTAAAAITGIMWPANRSSVFAFYILAVILTGLYGHARAAALALILSLLSMNYSFIPPYKVFSLNREGVYSLVLFSLVGTVIIVMIEKLNIRETKLRENKELFEKAFHSNPAGLAISRVRDGHYVELNNTFEMITGYTRQQIIGSTALKLGLGSAEMREKYVAELRETGAFRDRPFVLTNSAGEARHVVVSVDVISLHGEPHFLGIFNDITDRRKAEEEVREQAELLMNAQRIGRMGTWSLDLRTGRLVWSEATCHLFGITPAEFKGTFEQFHGFILPEDVSVYDAANARTSASEPLFEAEYRIRRPDGVVRWMYSRGHLSVDVSVAPVSLTGMVMDITERCVAREQLIENAALLRTAGRVAHLGGWILRLSDRALTWSDENCAIHEVSPGYKPTLDEGIGYFLPENRAEVLSYVEACEKDGTAYDFELPKMTAKGRRIWVRSIGEAVRDAEGKITHLHGAFQDVTDRRNAQEEMRQKDALIRMAGRITHTGGWAIEMPDQRVFWSEEVFDILGYARGNVPALEDGLALYLEPWREKIVTAIHECSQLGTPFDLEVEILTRQGVRKWVRVSGEAEWQGDGSIRRIQGAFQDITERKQLEQQYLRAQRMESIGTLAGGIAHDLNNVLAPILLSIGLLQQDEHDAARLRILAGIESSASRGASMISRLLSFAQGREGPRIQIHLTTLVREIAAIIRDTFPKNIRFEENLSSDLWTLKADPTQLHQVLLNLCVNARDAMPTGGEITITAKNVVIDEPFAARNIDAQAGPYVTVDIEDTGSGIPNEIIDRIFDPFFTTKALGKGTGLGLATSLAIVKGHGGFLRAYSNPGTGTRFRIYLPAQNEPATSIPPVTGSVLPRGIGATILVVDDEPIIREIAQLTLERFGYRVLLACDGAEAVALYAQHQSDIAVVLTDMAMPVMDGLATIRELVRMNPDVRIICASGFVPEAAEIGDSGLRVNRFLAKPYSAETLLTAIETALSDTIIYQ